MVIFKYLSQFLKGEELSKLSNKKPFRSECEPKSFKCDDFGPKIILSSNFSCIFEKLALVWNQKCTEENFFSSNYVAKFWRSQLSKSAWLRKNLLLSVMTIGCVVVPSVIFRIDVRNAVLRLGWCMALSTAKSLSSQRSAGQSSLKKFSQNFDHVDLYLNSKICATTCGQESISRHSTLFVGVNRIVINLRNRDLLHPCRLIHGWIGTVAAEDRGNLKYDTESCLLGRQKSYKNNFRIPISWEKDDIKLI